MEPFFSTLSKIRDEKEKQLCGALSVTMAPLLTVVLESIKSDLDDDDDDACMPRV